MVYLLIQKDNVFKNYVYLNTHYRGTHIEQRIWYIEMAYYFVINLQ